MNQGESTLRGTELKEFPALTVLGTRNKNEQVVGGWALPLEDSVLAPRFRSLAVLGVDSRAALYPWNNLELGPWPPNVLGGLLSSPSQRTTVRIQ